MTKPTDPTKDAPGAAGAPGGDTRQPGGERPAGGSPGVQVGVTAPAGRVTYLCPACKKPLQRFEEEGPPPPGGRPTRYFCPNLGCAAVPSPMTPGGIGLAYGLLVGEVATDATRVLNLDLPPADAEYRRLSAERVEAHAMAELLRYIADEVLPGEYCGKVAPKGIGEAARWILDRIEEASR